MERVPMKVIAHIQSDFKEKFGVPRQSGLVEELRARVIFEPEYRVREAFRGLEGFSHLWLLWEFSESVREEWSPTVRPPRLGGNRRVGVFATRSPFRPNPIGLSCVKLERIGLDEPQGPVLHVLGADLLDGTPIFDVKPYVPLADCRPEAAGGFSDEHKAHILTVDFPDSLRRRVPGGTLAALLGVLAQDPRPSYQNDPQRVYGLSFAGLEVKFTVEGEKLHVRGVEQDLRKSVTEDSLNGEETVELTVKEYDVSMREVFEKLFIDYSLNDLRMQEEDPRITPELLREKIVPLLLGTWERGAGSLALCFAEGRCAGFVCYQVDSEKSDWCKRPGWGLIREFYIVPEFRRRGYGRILAAYAVKRLREQSASLYLTAHDDAAAAFWAACGFRKTGEINQNGTATMEWTL